MDSEEARRVLFRRVQSLDSENGLKIMGYFLLQGWGEQEMLQLAMASDYVLQSLVAKSKLELGLTVLRKSSSDFSKSRVSPLDLGGFNSYSAEMSKLNEESSKIYSPYSLYQSNQNYCLPSQGLDQWHFNSTSSEAPLLSPSQLGLQTNNYNQEINTTIPFNNANKRLLPTAISPWDYSCMSSSISSSPKPCLYFARGYCKHGNNCRFSHTITTRDAVSSSPVLLDRSIAVGYNGGEEVPAVSLDSLRVELKELLRGRKSPVSIASLPQLYFEKYGKTLQADGYLTESQRHGKAGFSLTKLLLKLKNTVMLIDRPHGQHAVMLVEDDSGIEDSNNITGGPSSRQIYLTFPPESTFSEEDVIIHFRAYGPVEDVRIPYQQKRMFGFVTFTFSETVRNILKEGSPHYICGARVLVKPYKEKGKVNINDRKITERASNWMQSNGLINGESSPLISTALRYKMEEENISSLEKKIQDLNLDHSNNNTNTNNNNDINDFNDINDNNNNKKNNNEADDKDSVAAEDCFDLQPNMFSYVMDVLEGDGKENESAEFNDYPTHSTSEFTKPPLLHDPYRNISDPAMKTNNNLMASLAGPYNWSDPTLFAWSVY